MLEEFLNCRACMMFTKNDVPLLPDLQNIIQIKWASGDRIDSQCTRNIIDSYPAVYIYVCKRSSGLPYMLFSRSPHMAAIRVHEILQKQTDIKDIEESEIMSMFEV